MKLCLSLLLVIIAAFLSCRSETDEARILKLMKTVGKMVEAKDRPGLMVHLAEDYVDFENRNRSRTEAFIDEYFSRSRGIVVHLLHSRIEDLVEGKSASVDIDVVISSGGSELLPKLIRFSGDFYRVKAKLRKEAEGWKIVYVEWRDLGLDDLFPESMPILKKFFSGI